MALSLGPIPRGTYSPTRVRPPAAESSDELTTPFDATDANLAVTESTSGAAASEPIVSSSPRRAPVPVPSGPSTVRCACCGRLATADHHFGPVGPTDPTGAAAPSAAGTNRATDLAVSRYQRAASDPAQDEPSRIILG